jgi:hypothetical protein
LEILVYWHCLFGLTADRCFATDSTLAAAMKDSRETGVVKDEWTNCRSLDLNLLKYEETDEQSVCTTNERGYAAGRDLCGEGRKGLEHHVT